MGFATKLQREVTRRRVEKFGDASFLRLKSGGLIRVLNGL
jgi:hypothetical protein